MWADSKISSSAVIPPNYLALAVLDHRPCLQIPECQSVIVEWAELAKMLPIYLSVIFSFIWLRHRFRGYFDGSSLRLLSQPNSNTKRSWGDHIIEWNPPPHTNSTSAPTPGPVTGASQGGGVLLGRALLPDWLHGIISQVLKTKPPSWRVDVIWC